jgi:hypothetical protein
MLVGTAVGTEDAIVVGDCVPVGSMVGVLVATTLVGPAFAGVGTGDSGSVVMLMLVGAADGPCALTADVLVCEGGAALVAFGSGRAVARPSRKLPHATTTKRMSMPAPRSK